MLTQTVNQLKALRLGAMGCRLQAWMDDPANQAKSQIDCVMALAEAQAQAAAERKMQRFFATTGLPKGINASQVRVGAAFGLSVTLWANLCECDWVQRGHNLVITGPCRSGKTYVAGALARETQLRYPKARVVYGKTHDLLVSLELDNEAERARQLKRLSTVDLLVLDDFATTSLTDRQCQYLLHVMDERHRHERSTLVASPVPLTQWKNSFGDETVLDGISWRLFERSRQVVLTSLPPPAPPPKV
jgi:DNA replication protein DnaC